ncbi:MAG: transposase [Deltaproteobacteria bacterium]|nr:transposase [Deltaproteobacteria bacterium]
MSAKRLQHWSAEEKLQVVLEASSLLSEELGAFLRSKGLHESHLEQWRSQMLNGLHGNASPKTIAKKSFFDV